jgi:hypothetical protein
VALAGQVKFGCGVPFGGWRSILPSLVTGNGEIGVRSPFSMSSPVTHRSATGSQICRSCSFSMVELIWPLLPTVYSV